MIDIRFARFPEDSEGLAAIWRDYVGVPNTDLAFQDFDRRSLASQENMHSRRGAFGFLPAAPVSHNPISGTTFVGLNLQTSNESDIAQNPASRCGRFLAVIPQIRTATGLY
jgi:hypothetical protein